MLIVPLQPVPNQTLQTQLDGQNCTLNVYQYAYGLFMDVLVGSTTIIVGQACENLNRIVRSAYLGFSGDLCFLDTLGADDPVYTGLGSRFQLCFIEPSDLAAAGDES